MWLVFLYSIVFFVLIDAEYNDGFEREYQRLKNGYIPYCSTERVESNYCRSIRTSAGSLVYNFCQAKFLERRYPNSNACVNDLFENKFRRQGPGNVAPPRAQSQRNTQPQLTLSEARTNLPILKSQYYSSSCGRTPNTRECLNRLDNMRRLAMKICRSELGLSSVSPQVKNCVGEKVKEDQSRRHENRISENGGGNRIPEPEEAPTFTLNYDDYGGNPFQIEEFKRKESDESEEVKSSAEEDYDEDAWRKKSSKEELLDDVGSLEKEVGQNMEGSFRLPGLKNHEIMGEIGDELISKYNRWLSTIDRRVYSNNVWLVFMGPQIYGRGVYMRPVAFGDGVIKFIPINENYAEMWDEGIVVDFLSGKTNCGHTSTFKKSYICIKPLDIHIRVRPETAHQGPFSWDLMCMQLYLPAWKYGYEFCFNMNSDGHVFAKSKQEDHHFREMRVFVFNGGTFKDWGVKYL